MIMGKSLLQQRYEVLSNKTVHRPKRGFSKLEPAHHYTQGSHGTSRCCAHGWRSRAPAPIVDGHGGNGSDKNRDAGSQYCTLR